MRIFSRGALVTVHLFLLFLVVVFVAMARVESGPMSPAAWGVALAALLVWVALVVATLLPRCAAPEPDADGLVVIAAPLTLVGPLLAGWAVMLVAVAAWVVVAVTDFGSLENPGWLLVMVLGGLGSLPDLVRLLTGRLHRWRIDADARGVRYRGYHTDRRLAWAEISSARVQAKPPGVLLATRVGEPPLLVPAVAFDVAPDEIVASLKQCRGRAAR